MSLLPVIRRNLAIRLAIIRQRSPYVLRDMLAREPHKRERAQAELLDAILSELERSPGVRRSRSPCRKPFSGQNLFSGQN
jgi:hypothetical protein